MAVTVNNTVFGVVLTSCSSEGRRRFGGTTCSAGRLILLVSSLVYPSPLKMKAICFSATLGSLRTTAYGVKRPEDVLLSRVFVYD